MDTYDLERGHYYLRVDGVPRRKYSKDFMSLSPNDLLELLSGLPNQILIRVCPLHTQYASKLRMGGRLLKISQD